MVREAVNVSFLLLLALPFMGSVVALVAKGRKVPFFASTLFLVVSLLFYIVLLASTGCGAKVVMPYFGFTVDGFGLVLAGVALIVGLLVLLYSYDYMSSGNVEHPVEGGWSRYYALMSLFVGAMIGVAFSSNLLLLVAFYELTSICSCFLISFYGTREATRSGLEALILTTLGGFCLLMATAITYIITGSMDLKALAQLKGTYALLVGVLILLAGWAKSAQLPFHIWLPDAMVAPTTVSAYLHAAAMVKVGVFVFLRYTQFAALSLDAFNAKVIGYLALLGALATMFYGAFSYYRCKDLKRLLAYSTIVQLSIMFCVLSIPYLQHSLRGAYAAAYHIWNHAYTKALLFLAVGALAYATGKRSIDVVEGIAAVKELRIIAYTWLIGSLAISAIPPFNCFFSKLAILFTGFRGPVEALAAVILVFAESYLLTLPIFLKVSMSAFKSDVKAEAVESKELPTTMKIVLAVLSLATIASAFATPIEMPIW